MLFDAYANVQPDVDLLKKNQEAVRASIATHGYQLTAEDLNRIDYIYEVFSRGGPRMNYAFASTVPPNLQGSVTFRQLMNMTYVPAATRHSLQMRRTTSMCVRCSGRT